jgi:hypothetical protein
MLSQLNDWPLGTPLSLPQNTTVRCDAEIQIIAGAGHTSMFNLADALTLKEMMLRNAPKRASCPFFPVLPGARPTAAVPSTEDHSWPLLAFPIHFWLSRLLQRHAFAYQICTTVVHSPVDTLYCCCSYYHRTFRCESLFSFAGLILIFSVSVVAAVFGPLLKRPRQ